MQNAGSYEYANELADINSNKKNELTAYRLSKNELKEHYSFMGYASKRVFWIKFGDTLFALFPILLLIIVIINPAIIKSLKKFLTVGTLGFAYVFFFWFFYSLFVEFDYEIWVYKLAYIIAALIATSLIFLIFLHFERKAIHERKINEAFERILLNGEEIIRGIDKDNLDTNKKY